MITPSQLPRTAASRRRARYLSLREWSALLVIAIVVSVCGDSRAGGRVPSQLQAQLVSRLGSFDRNFPARAGSLARVLVVHRAGNAESEFAAAGFARALVDLKQIGGVPVSVDDIVYSDAAALAARCRKDKIAVLYFSETLDPEMASLASALAGADILTIGASSKHAEKGAVVGFDLEEARPKLVLNLRSARAQNVAFKAELLKLGRIVE